MGSLVDGHKALFLGHEPKFGAVDVQKHGMVKLKLNMQGTQKYCGALGAVAWAADTLMMFVQNETLNCEVPRIALKDTQ
jgi:hypothetical protein